MVAAAIGGAAVASLAGSALSAGAASDAADTQADAANRSADMQWKQYQQTRTDLEPYRNLGSSAINPLLAAMGYNVSTNKDGTFALSPSGTSILQQRFTAPTAAEAAATPGYQFTLQQGLKAAQNSASARGLGASGAALKGAASFASGLADTTYNDVYSRNLNTFKTNYGSAADNVNRLFSLVGTGQNAAALTGGFGAQAANSVGNTLTSGAAASAAGTVGAANAINGGLSGAANTVQNGLLMNRLFPSATSGGAATSGATLYGVGGNINPAAYGVGNNVFNFTG
ncbi:DNA transfer protein p32 [Burkholderia stagnalis]|uniref:DNA transfer protein p32 n=1 Tax=Burkholderia stagnalis TaxID=1503054 RepID=UPI000F5AAB2A|nr:DNA transfer protein p32 [Burkholderia stagnalis]RQQ19732.1 DNA transfer protein p32 [Burkholderia stagnalis]RQY67281.1 DNA transfer protein p32 [Burkholderia stagnalis]RQY80046.1 DNA transfer protein p32 [Burkholderia stagnalis]